MNYSDILEIEQLKYCYEQAYVLHRHTGIPDLFVRDPETVFTLPSAGDRTVGWDLINEKFCRELYYVSPNEDSFHTGWQICTPVIWEDSNGEISGIFPTFGFLVLSMDPATMKPPYRVLSTLELWRDRFAKQEDRWKIRYLQAQFLLGQCVHSWNPSEDTGYAVQKQLRQIPHPALGAFSGGVGVSAHRSTPENENHSGVSMLRKTVLSCSAYYGVQFCQGLYTLLWECGRMEEIPELLFSGDENVSVSYDGEERAEGQSGIRTFFRKMQERTKEQGGFWRADLPATQWIEGASAGGTVTGHWITMTRRIDISSGQSFFSQEIGCFTNEFSLEEGVWKLKSIRYERLQGFAQTGETPDRNLEEYRRSPGTWLTNLPYLSDLSEKEDEPDTAETLALRNEILSWFNRHSAGVRTDGLFPCSKEQLRKEVFKTIGNCRYILATSPVIRMEENHLSAEAFFSISLFRDEQDAMTDIRGSIFMTLNKGDRGWEISSFSWYPYAALEPWQKR